MKAKVLFLFFITQTSLAAVYDCNRMTPHASHIFDRKVVIECDLDSQANPKFVVLSGSSKIPLNTKALYIGKEIAKEYEKFEMTAHDGSVFGISAAGRMFLEGLRTGGFITVEPDNKGGYWACHMRM